MKQVWRVTPVLVLCLAVASFSGCGGGDAPKMKVDGKLMKGKQPLAEVDGQKVNLSFASRDPKDGKAYVAVVNSDGSFDVNPSGGGIPAGKYKISINVTMEGNDTKALQKQTKLNEQFGAINGAECEITSDPVQHLTIDVVTGGVTR